MKRKTVYSISVGIQTLAISDKLHTAYTYLLTQVPKGIKENVHSYSQITRQLKKKNEYIFYHSYGSPYVIKKYVLIQKIDLL